MGGLIISDISSNFLKGGAMNTLKSIILGTKGIWKMKEGIFIQAADKAYADAVGGQIVSVGGMPTK